jgi:hypothetical protein
MTEPTNFRPLELFVAHYEDLKLDFWRTPAIESKPKALKRVLAMAREYRRGSNWTEQITGYLEDFRLALAAARRLPLDARTTIWRVSGPAFVKRMAGSYRLDLPRIHEGDWQSVQWLRLSDQTAADVWLMAKEQNTTCSRILSRIVEEHFQAGLLGQEVR